MIKSAGNVHDEVKEKGKSVCETEEEDGLKNLLQLLRGSRVGSQRHAVLDFYCI